MHLEKKELIAYQSSLASLMLGTFHATALNTAICISWLP
jgi:hypothetical protein